jgi:hypothetical protein
MDIAFLHGRIATAMVLFTLVAGVYGLVEYFRKHSVSPSYWGIIVVGNLMAVGQGLIGLWLALGGGQPAREWVHILYGVVAVMWIPLIQFFNRNREGRSETLVVALVSLFECGIALRAIATAT